MANSKLFKRILITGGLGDFLAIDSFLSRKQKKRITTICLATRAAKYIKNLFNKKNSFYERLESIQILDYDFSQIGAFHSKKEAKEKIILEDQNFWENLYDGSMSNIFELAKICKMEYHQSSFLDFSTNLEKFNLPKDYIFILPNSKNLVNSQRNFDYFDWSELLVYLKNKNLKGVCIGDEKIEIPNDDSLINLQRKTGIIESIEILKNARGYIGIDSWASVLATKVFKENDLYIKSNSNNCYRWAHIYFRPYEEYNFIFHDLKSLNIRFP